MGVLGRIRSDLDGHLLTSFYDTKVLPYLQYCLMVRVDFKVSRNRYRNSETLLKLQKGLIAGKGRYYVDHLHTEYGFLKVGTYIGSSSGFMPRSFGTECSTTVRRRCLEVWMSPMAMIPGLLGQD